MSCDQSVAVAGDACVGPGFACAPDLRSDLSCRAGAFVVAQTCAGPFACRIAPYDGVAPGGSGSVLCDNDVSRADDPCLDDGDYACTPDKLEALKCVDKKMASFGACDGPDHCSVIHRTSKETDVECDTLRDGGP